MCRFEYATGSGCEGFVWPPVIHVGVGENLECFSDGPSRGVGNEIKCTVIDAATKVYIKPIVVVVVMADGGSVKRRVFKISQSVIDFHDVATNKPIDWSAPVLFCCFTRDIWECLIHAARFAAINEVGVLFSKTVGHFMGRHIDINEREKCGVTIAKGHGWAIPKGIAIIIVVMNAHHQLECERRYTEPVLVHIKNDATKIVGVIKRGVCAVNGFYCVVGTSVAVGRRTWCTVV